MASAFPSESLIKCKSYCALQLISWVGSIIKKVLPSAPLTVIAKVAWCPTMPDNKGVEIGARYLDIPEDDLKALKTHLDQIRQAAVSRTSEV